VYANLFYMVSAIYKISSNFPVNKVRAAIIPTRTFATTFSVPLLAHLLPIMASKNQFCTAPIYAGRHINPSSSIDSIFSRSPKETKYSALCVCRRAGIQCLDILLLFGARIHLKIIKRFLYFVSVLVEEFSLCNLCKSPGLF
jgi:hypothetical protein